MKSVDCACVIHGDYYNWQYVERLYNMLTVRCEHPVTLHVYTEAEREVPDYMVKHELMPWPGITGPRRSWWYKMQLFNSKLFSGQLFYLDLDTVIVNSIDWVWQLDPAYFYAIRDFKHLWRPSWPGINSSLMRWNTDQYHWIWDTFVSYGPEQVIKQFRGDQDFLSELLIRESKFRYFESDQAVSWRWQALDGGYDMKKRRHLTPGTGTQVKKNTSFLIFHGNPKPHNIKDSVVQQHWQMRHIV